MVRWTRLVVIVGVLSALGACGDDDGGGGGGTPDAAPSPDAGFAPFCFDKSDSDCGYAIAEVTADEISLADQQALAERFNPAHVYTFPHIWAVSVDYLLEQGANGLERAEHDGRLNFSYDVDEATREVVDPQPNLLTDNWTDLPTTTAGGADLVYFLDIPGDNTGPNYEDETWSAAWIEAQGGDDSDPTTANYPPAQYAHLFWLDRDEQLLVIQYWFYHPFNKFINSHEGDWEHVNVVLRYTPNGDASIVGAHYSLHGFQGGLPVDEVIRVGDRDGGDGDHIVVFTGGDSCANFVPDVYCGSMSGASFPWPGLFEFNSPETAAGGASLAGRPIHANDFAVILLPRIEDIDFDARPNLSWYALPFLNGQPTASANSSVVTGTNNHRSVVSPSPAHAEFQIGIEEYYDYATYAAPEPFTPIPTGWTLIADPSQDFGN